MRWSSQICVGLVCLVSAWANPAVADDLVPLPTQPADVPWPTEDWSTATLSPEEQESLKAILDPVFATDIGEGLGETRGVLVIKNGALVHERYRGGFGPDTKHISWSVNKSITTTLVGRAVHTGLVASIDDPMPAAFEDGDPRLEISWRHWMQMLDGLDYQELGQTELLEIDSVLMMYGDGRFDQLAYAREHFGPEKASGTYWNYSTIGMHLIARALQSLLPGTCIDPDANPRTCNANPRVMTAWIDEVFETPLGIDAVFEFDAAGTMLGGSNAYLSARDYAKFGLLILRDGVWDGERLLPEGWVDLNRTNPPQTESNEYGMGFWPSPEDSDNPGIDFLPPYDAFHAGGREGQLVWIVPSRDLVIVRVGLMTDVTENWNRLFELAQEIGAALD